MVFMATISSFLLVFLGSLLLLRPKPGVKRLLEWEEGPPVKPQRRWARLGRIGQVFVQPGGRMTLRLERAGLQLKLGEFYGLRLVVAGMGATVGLLWGLAGIGVGGLLGWFLPLRVLDLRYKKRLVKLETQIPEALTLISNSLKAGFSFFQAMDLVAKEMEAPINTAFARALREMQVGRETDEALEAMGERLGSEDLDLVLTSVLIQRQVGGNLAEILEKISGTIRERIRIRGEIRTLTAQGRISGLVISLLPLGLGLLLYTINPGYMSLLFLHPVGQALIVVALIGQAIGALIIRRVIQIEI